MANGTFDVTLTRERGYEFVVRFEQDGIAELTVDELPPVGRGAGPNPTALLAAAVGSCLGASLLFCLQKARVAVGGMTTEVHGTIERNDKGRLRVTRIEVRLAPELEDADGARVMRCVDLFEDFCTVTQSVRQGIEVDVVVAPRIRTAEPA
ncbi:MAG TPA: OsmC family protein [Longimicrobiales bacterium]